MKVTWQQDSDMAYLYLKDAIGPGEVVRTVVCEDPDLPALVNFDLDAHGVVIGIEFMDATQMLPRELLAQAPRRP